MAQVRKYSKGNKITKAENGEPILFTWDGYGDYNVADLERTYARNAENYVKSLGLNEEDSKKVLDRSYAILQAMKNGQIKNRNSRGQWTNVPVGFESTGINEQERKKILGLGIGKKQYTKDADFYNNLGYNIMDQVLRGTSIYVKPTKEQSSINREKYNSNFEDYLTKYYFKDLGFNSELWDYENAKPNIIARLNDYRNYISNQELSDEEKNDWFRRIDSSITALNDNNENNDYSALASLGWDARKWLIKDYSKQSENTSSEEPIKETIITAPISAEGNYNGKVEQIYQNLNKNNKQPKNTSSEEKKTPSKKVMTFEQFMTGTAGEEGRLHKNPVVPTMLLTGIFGEPRTRLGKAARIAELELNSIGPIGGFVNAYNLFDNNIGWRNWWNFWKKLPRTTWNYLTQPIEQEKNGGKIPFNKKGTKITKYQYPAGPMPTGVGFADNTSWYGNVFTPMWKNILEGLKNRTFTYQDLNNMQSNHAKLYNAAGNNFINQAYRNNAVGEYQAAYNTIGGGFGNTVGIANAYSTNRYMRGNNPISGDNPQQNYKVDNLYSGITDDRRLLGRQGDFTPEQLVQINKDLNSLGLVANLDLNDNYYKISPLSLNASSLATTPNIGNLNTDDLNLYRNDNSVAGTIELPELEVTATNSSSKTGESGGLQTTSGGTKPQVNWGDILGTARLAGTIWTNNRIAKGLKDSLSPLLLDPVQLRRQVTGDLVTRNYMENLGAEANRIGARPITSDASLQLGQQLDYNNRANEYRIKGYLADKQAIDKTTAEAQKVADFNKQQRVDVANRNRAAMLGIRQAKANIEAQRKSANWAQAVAPWLMDKEMRWRENQKLNRALNYQENQYLYGDQYEQAAKNAQAAIDQAKARYLSIDGNNETGWLTSPENAAATKIYKSAMEDAAKTYRDNMLKARKQAYTYNPFLFTFKSGGQLNYKEKSLLQRADAVNKSFLNDRKLFHKMITDSQKENNKLIMSLGGLTKELIIKSMTYAG